MKKLLVGLLLFIAGVAFAAPGERVVEFGNATATLHTTPCALGGTVDPKSELKAGSVVMKSDGSKGTFCWVEEEGQIWFLTDSLQIFSIDASRAKPKGHGI